MRAPSLANLLYLDVLEMYGNSRRAAELCFLSQSSIYRSAMALSQELGFNLHKRDGAYQCTHNLDVLANLREAAQMLRARSGAPLRLQADYRSPLLRRSLSKTLWHLPQTWLGLRHSLQHLDAALLDLLIVRSSELLPLLGQLHQPLAVGQWRYTPRHALLPLNTETVQVYAKPQHPLLERSALQPKHLAAYPSPALSESQVPGLRQRLQPHGLGTTLVRRKTMQPGFWEHFALEHHMLVPSTPNAITAATSNAPGSLEPLTYPTGLTDHDVLVVPQALLDEPAIQQAIQVITAAYNLVIPSLRLLPGLSHRQLHPSPIRSRQA